MARKQEVLAGGETVVGSVVPQTRIESDAPARLWIAVARFARRKPLGAVGGLIVLALVVTALLAPLISPYDPRQIIREADNRVPVYVAPGAAYPMGTDHVGRDIVSRVIHGARISLYVGLGAVLIGVTADRKSTRLNSSHGYISYAVFCLKKKKIKRIARHDL